jgi:hypothetical protein
LTDVGEILVRPVPWQPHPLRLASDRRPRRRLPWLAALVALVLVLASAFLLAARAVEVQVEPAPDRLSVNGGPRLHFGAHWLLLPGAHSVRAEKAGYHPLDAALEVTRDPRQIARFALERLPGRLVLEVTPEQGVQVSVDGLVRGSTPLEALELPAGDRELLLHAEGFAPFTQRLRIEGGGVTQTVQAALRPDRAPVSFSSEPPGARVRVDGAVVGSTPLTLDLTSGQRRVEMALEGYRSETRLVPVAVDRPLAVPLVRLEPLPGRLSLTSEPTGAAVSVNGQFRGETPLELDLPAGPSHAVKATKAGHDAAEAAVTLARGEARPLLLRLTAQEGEVQIASEPPDAEVFVDGQPRGRTSRTVSP